jgi:hypothetical protein
MHPYILSRNRQSKYPHSSLSPLNQEWRYACAAVSRSSGSQHNKPLSRSRNKSLSSPVREVARASNDRPVGTGTGPFQVPKTQYGQSGWDGLTFDNWGMGWRSPSSDQYLLVSSLLPRNSGGGGPSSAVMAARWRASLSSAESAALTSKSASGSSRPHA